MPRQRDFAEIETDRIIEELEKAITKEYAQATKEVEAKLADYLRRFEIKDKKWQQWVKQGKKTQAEYQQWRKGQILMGKRWEDMKNVLAEDLTNASKIASSITNGYLPDVYALNHNYGTFDVESKSMIDTSYTLYSREAVERLFRGNERFYKRPGKVMSEAIRQGKQKAWDRQQIQSVMLQGILQGEGIPSLTKRLETVTGGDHKAAIRNARTMVTGIQNAGRLDAFHRAQDMGIETEKTWIATLDDRTRHWHRELDGVTMPIDDPFENEVGEIMYPGDPEADEANVYNCRCTLLSTIGGFNINFRDMSLRNDSKLGDMTYEEWLEGHSVSQPITAAEDRAEAIRQSYVMEYRR